MKPLLYSLWQKITQWATYLWLAIKHGLAVFPAARIAKDTGLLVTLLLLTVLGINWMNSDKPILGLRLEGQLVGGLNGTNIHNQVDTIINNYENKPLAVQVADTTGEITLRQLGVAIDENHVYTELRAAGRTGNVLHRLADQMLAPLGRHNVRLGHSGFDAELARGYIATLDQKIHLAPENAYFIYKDQQVTINSDKQGLAIDTEAALVALGKASPLRSQQIALPTTQLPATVTSAMLEPLLPEAQAIAQKPLTIAAGESRTTLSPEQLVALFVPKIVPDPADPNKTIAQLTFDEAKLNAVVDEVIGRAVVAPKPTIMSGGGVIQQGTSGVSTEDSHSLARVLAALVARQTGAGAPDEATIPLVAVDPPVVQQVTPRTRTGTGLVRLTFDDGPGGYTDQILDILNRYNVHATFYVIGRNVNGNPAQMQRTKNEGHTICNHSFSHANLARLSGSRVRQELSDTQAAIQQASGVTPNCFRPPYGSHNQTVREVAASLGLSIDMWSIDTRDWARPGSSVITRRVLDNTHSGAVVLLHVLNQQTVTALPSIIEGIRAQGYTLE